MFPKNKQNAHAEDRTISTRARTPLSPPLTSSRRNTLYMQIYNDHSNACTISGLAARRRRRRYWDRSIRGSRWEGFDTQHFQHVRGVKPGSALHYLKRIYSHSYNSHTCICIRNTSLQIQHMYADVDFFEGTTKTVQAPLSAKNSTIFVAI